MTKHREAVEEAGAAREEFDALTKAAGKAKVTQWASMPATVVKLPNGRVESPYKLPDGESTYPGSFLKRDAR